MFWLKRERQKRKEARQRTYDDEYPTMLKYLKRVLIIRYLNGNYGHYSKAAMRDDVVLETCFGSAVDFPDLREDEIHKLYVDLYRVCRYLDIIDTSYKQRIFIK